jgi:uncharacterized membrane protein YkoI
MKTRTLALTVFAFFSASAIGAAASLPGRTLGLGEVVTHLESRYPGQVVAIALDSAGDKAAHYHVDMRFAESELTRLDVDAVTLDIALREPAPLAAGSATLADVAALLGAAIPGEITVAQLDQTNGLPPHYDVDVRLPQGPIARLKVDAATREIGWRYPAIIAD